MDDDTGAEDAILEAMAASNQMPKRVQQPAPQRIQQPTPQRLDRAPPAKSSSSSVVQPTPQALPPKKAASAILVSPRQRGNPVTCVLFLSLKYHRLHPEYIMVDIPNHEDSLRELSNSSLINNVTVILCWSAAEAARYLELYKSYENASFAAIRGQQPSSYAERLVDFVTVPRSLNKSDAVALVANFGSLKNAVNADAEQLGMIAGWGGVKVKRWADAVEEPFRTKKASKRGAIQATVSGSAPDNRSQRPSQAALFDNASTAPRAALKDASTAPNQLDFQDTAPKAAAPGQFQFLDDMDDEESEDVMLAAAIEESKRMSQPGQPPESPAEDLGEGVAAALAKLRENH